MASQDVSYLRFSLEETVWFSSGQEVKELYSISLDPQIQSEEEDQFVRMHGFLELSGEYAPSEKKETEQTVTTTHKFVQQVLERGDSECEFFHRFPIDITIPKNRIAKMEDVEIYIDSFDYEFPEKANLKLTVDLSISGIAEEQPAAERAPAAKTEAAEAAEETEEIVEVKKKEEPVKNMKEEEPAEVKKKEEVKSMKKEEPEFSILKLDVNTTDSMEKEEEAETDFSVEVKRQPDLPEKEVESQLIEAIEKRKEKRMSESPNIILDMESVNQEPTETAPATEDISEEPADIQESPDLTDSPSNEPEAVEPKKKKAFGLKKKETMSLADFFARKEPEEAVTWKVCLVQKDDTLQKVAERYGLPVADLVRENRLETNQSIEEGQVLYIPSSHSAGK
ncbi:stage VI sporulation protein D [Bacillus aerolatus]|uniref:stage VI sporulation protein D n=1 Tax=Bacillus aerolatus TaxID=2653354 RepID=UPI0017875C5A|nr:stage VI sporulation protein D [Bacillus aerolatus]